ncbi:MAG: dodecin family protein [Solirubrobacterales bacterium]
MSVAKVVEITATSSTGTDDAVKSGLAKASESIRGITGAWVKDEQVVVENGEITEWRVNLKVTFLLD